MAEFVRAQRAEYGIPRRVSCQVPRVSESWFHKQVEDPATRREARRTSLDEEIKRIFDRSGGTYGSDLHQAGARSA
ncbi:hypothetical protein [Streptomyces sp. NPDC127066]|uniref:hypothetical protein n=1 Tax=Streptomyces sp. NPDC127066 TaxID=3347125 RepID=UPI0036512F2A